MMTKIGWVIKKGKRYVEDCTSEVTDNSFTSDLNKAYVYETKYDAIEAQLTGEEIVEVRITSTIEEVNNV